MFQHLDRHDTIELLVRGEIEDHDITGKHLEVLELSLLGDKIDVSLLSSTITEGGDARFRISLS